MVMEFVAGELCCHPEGMQRGRAACWAPAGSFRTGPRTRSRSSATCRKRADRQGRAREDPDWLSKKIADRTFTLGLRRFIFLGSSNKGPTRARSGRSTS